MKSPVYIYVFKLFVIIDMIIETTLWIAGILIIFHLKLIYKNSLKMLILY